MAKSIRSKIKKRYRTVKRQRVAEMIDKPRHMANNRMIAKIAEGLPFEKKKSKNAFLHPNDPTARFPQITVMKPVDFRSSHLPMAGFATKGNRRKYNEKEKAELLALSKIHPKIERLAGAPLPDVYRTEEEIEREGEAGVAPASTSMSPAIPTPVVMMDQKAPKLEEMKEEEMKDQEEEEEEEEEEVKEGSPAEPDDGVDTTRKPIKKDLRKQQQPPKKKEVINAKKKSKNPQRPGKK